MFYELVYETGEHSVASYDSDEEALKAISEQHRRATTGELGGPEGTQWPATRVKRVLVYDQHPSELYESQTVPVEQLNKWFAGAVEKNALGDLVSVPMVIAALREELNALANTEPHESNYKMKEARELKEASWQ